MNLKELVLKATLLLKEAGASAPRLDAEIFMEKILSADRIFLISHPDYEIEAEKAAEYFAAVEERAKGRPTAYITGEKEFMGLSFLVNEAVLIPRPDTELSVEKAMELLSEYEPENSALRILDLCTGSGAIAVSLARYLKNAQIFATDISEAALEIAGKNARRNNAEVTFLKGNLFEAVKGIEGFDIIVSNPPYIPSEDVEELERDVKDYEPRLALDGGKTGMDFYEKIIPQAGAFLKPHGCLVLEIGYNQAEAVKRLGEKAGIYAPAEIFQDLAGLDRCAVLKKSASD